MERNRRPDIDWLRVFATYLLFMFHVGKVFDPAPFYHVRNADLSSTGLRVAPALQEGFRRVIPNGLPVAEPFHEGFFTFLPTFVTLDRFTWGHLWFVAYLLTLTLLYLPGFAWLAARGDRLKRVGTWVVYLPVLPL